MTYGPFGAGLDLIKNGQADLIINMLAFPSSQVNNAARDVDFTMIGLSPEVIKTLVDDMGVKEISIDKDIYPFMDSNINTVTGSVILAAAVEMSDQEAADIVRAMLKNFDYLQSAHATLSRLTPEALTDTSPIALHPGATTAYREAGLLK